MTELKPCPFCGGRAEWCNDKDCSGCHLINCEECFAQFDLGVGIDADTLVDMRIAVAKIFNSRSSPKECGHECYECQLGEK